MAQPQLAYLCTYCLLIVEIEMQVLHYKSPEITRRKGIDQVQPSPIIPILRKVPHKWGFGQSMKLKVTSTIVIVNV